MVLFGTQYNMSNLQPVLFLLFLVWIPILINGSLFEFYWLETKLLFVKWKSATENQVYHRLFIAYELARKNISCSWQTVIGTVNQWFLIWMCVVDGISGIWLEKVTSVMYVYQSLQSAIANVHTYAHSYSGNLIKILSTLYLSDITGEMQVQKPMAKH